jgi:hypothetical protein
MIPPPTLAGDGLHGTLNRLQQRIEIKGAVVADAVDEERRRAVHAAAHAAQEIVTHPGGMGMPGEVAGEWLDVEAERGGLLQQVLVLERVLIRE